MAIEPGMSRERAMACRASECRWLTESRRGPVCGAAVEIRRAQITNATIPGVDITGVMDAAKGLARLQMPGDCSRQEELLFANPLPLQH